MKIFQRIIGFKRFLRNMDMKPVYFIIPAILSLGVALFEGISAWLLIPIAKGVVSTNFIFVKNLAFVKPIIMMFPSLFSGNTQIFILLIALAFITAVIKNILLYLSVLGVSYQVVKFNSNLRKLIFDRYLSFGKLFFDRNNLGYLHNALLNFTNMVSQQLKGLNSLLTSFFMLIVYVVMLCAISWKLTVFAIALFPTMQYASKWLIVKIKKTSKYHSDSHNRISKKIFDILSCIPLVKAYTQEKEEQKRFDGINKLVAQLDFSIQKKQSLVPPLQESAMLFVLLLFVGAVAFLVIKERASEISSFLVYFYIMRRAMVSFNNFIHFRVSLAGVGGPIQKISEILDDKEKYFIIDGQKEFMGLKKNIEFNHLSFSYQKGIEVLKDVSLCIEKGKITAIVGPTGAGKTTLINLLMRFYDVLPLSILVDGIDIRDFTLESLRKHIALVSQETLLFNDTIKENITYGITNVTKEQLVETTRKARLYDFIMSLPQKFDSLVGDRGVKLSGGEKQRISIARALLKSVEILILDEATSSLDSKTEKLIQEAINEAVKDRTTIVIAHRLSTIKNADKVIVIEAGRLAEDGALNELLDRKGKFYEYWNAQKFY